MSGTSKRVQGAQTHLHYVDYGGNGPHGLVMLHGGGANTHWFDFVGPPLAKHVRAFALDLRGHGDSNPTEPPMYDYDAYMQDIRDVINAEQLHQPIVMGHSMGGMLMVKFAGTWPRDISALIVCDARPVYGEDDQERLQRTGQRSGREYTTQAEYIANFRIRPDGLVATDEVRQYVARFAGKQLPHGTWVHKIDRRVYAQRTMIDTRPLWQNITCPVLFLRAGCSSRVTAAMLQQIKDACPHVEVATVDQAAHHLTLDQPERTAELVLDFLHRHRLTG